MERTLVVGDPIVHLGDEAFIPDGALIVEGKKVVEAGPRILLEAMGPFDRVVGSPDHFVVPGFVASHFHSEVALGPGIYEMLFERANIFVHPLFKDMDHEVLYNGILVTLMQAMRGGITTTVDAFYGRPGPENFGMDIGLKAYEDIGMRTGFGKANCKDRAAADARKAQEESLEIYKRLQLRPDIKMDILNRVIFFAARRRSGRSSGGTPRSARRSSSPSVPA